ARAHRRSETPHRLGIRRPGQRRRDGRLGKLRSPDRSHRGVRVRGHLDRAVDRLQDGQALAPSSHVVRVTPRLGTSSVLATALLPGCAGGQLRPAEAAALAGTWRGRMSGPIGNGAVILTIAENGSFQGLLFVEPQYQELRGAITVLGPENIRYDGN